MPTLLQPRLLLLMLLPALSMALTLAYHQDVHRLISFGIILPFLPYLLVLPGIGLAWGFNNGREFNLLLVLGITYWVLREFIWQPNLPIPAQSLLYVVICMLLPLNFLTHVLLPERGVLRWQVLKRLSISLAQVLGLAVLFTFPYGTLQEALRAVLWKNPWPQYVLLPQPAIVAIGVTIVAILMQLRRQTHVLQLGNLMAFVACTLGLNSVAQPDSASLFFSIAAGSILIAMAFNSYNLAYLDELTNLPTRRALKQHLVALGKRYSIAMVDIDHFKKLNDRYGHDVGDQVLRMVAAHLAQIGGGGKAFRYGGEEFTILFANLDATTALPYVDELRHQLSKTPFILRQRKRPRHRPEHPVKHERVEKLTVSFSAGIAQYQEHHDSPAAVMKLADKALYAAKHAGRNRVQVL